MAWNDEPGDRPGFWSLTRYDDVMRVNSDYATFSSQKGGILMAHQRSEMQLAKASLDAMITMDAPAHMQLRREHMPYFTAAYLRGLTDRVEGEVTRLLDAMAPLGKCDLVPMLSSQLPLFTLCEILGVPQADRGKFLTWMHYLELANSFAAERSGATGGDMEGAAADLPPELKMFLDAFQAAVAEMFEYGRDMLHKRRLDPQPDLLSAIARAQIDGEFLADEYLDGSWLLIVFAGNDTTRNTISGAMELLSQYQDQKARLIAKPELMGGAVNEIIRMVSPVIYMRRTATRDVEVAGQQIAEGEKGDHVLRLGQPRRRGVRRSRPLRRGARQRRQAHRLRLRPAHLHRQAGGQAAVRGGLPPDAGALPRHPPGGAEGRRAQQLRLRDPLHAGGVHGGRASRRRRRGRCARRRRGSGPSRRRWSG